MKKRLIVKGLVLALVLLVSAVCFGSGGQEAKVDVTLVYWSMWNETEAQAMVLKDGIADFEKANPGVKIEVQWNGREIRKTLQPALDAGTVIDMWDEDAERVVKTWQDYSLKLDAYYQKSYSADGKAFKDVTMGSLVNLISTFSTDGGLYCVPYQPFVVSTMYNKDHFDKAGISKLPTTWAEFLAACAKLKAAGFIPLTIDDAYMDLPIGYHLARMFGDYKDVEALVKDKTGELWNDPRVLQVAKDLAMLAANGYMSPQVADNKWPAGQQEVATDQVSMYFLNGTWLPNEVMNTTGEEFRWGQFAYPTVTNGAGGLGAAIYAAQSFQISKNCKNPDIAFALAAHLTTGKWDQIMSEKTYGAPMDSNSKWPAQISDSEVIFNNLDTWMPWSAGLAADPDTFAIVKKEFTALLSGTVTAEEFVANIKGQL
jgi:raffinose/stachyose/melibiose transport system substrate-binding protein